MSDPCSLRVHSSSGIGLACPLGKSQGKMSGGILRKHSFLCGSYLQNTLGSFGFMADK